MKTKIDIVSGFLGSGKTTYIQNLLRVRPMHEKTVLIENEFGKFNLDGVVLNKEGIDLYEITSGCICCSMSGDFSTSVKKILSEIKPDRIIIEPTGVALLSEVIRSLKDPDLRPNIEMDRIITMLDVPRFNQSVFVSKGFIDNQLKEAKTVVLNKVEGADPRLVKEVITYVKTVNSKAHLLRFSHLGKSGTGLSIAIRGADLLQSKACDGYDSIEFETDKQIKMVNLVRLFTQSAFNDGPGIIIRAKGIVQSGREKWNKFDFVMGSLAMEDFSAQKSGKICFIGTNLNREKIEALLF